MSTFVKQTHKMFQQCVAELKRKLPPKYLQIMSIGTAAFGFWIIRNVFWKILYRIRTYPAGPLGLPLFGCLFPFAINPMKFVVQLGQCYGSVAFVPLMVSNNLFINDPVIVKHLFQTKKLISRPTLTLRNPTSYIWQNGKAWKTGRQLFSQTAITLSNSSFVLNNVRQAMDCVIPRMEQRIERKELWIPSHDAQYFGINTAWTVIFDHVLSIDDPFVSLYCNHMERAVKMMRIGILLDLFSNYSGWKLLPKYTTWKVHDEADDMLAEWMKRNGFEIDRKRKIMRRVKAPKTKVYADFLIEKLERGEIEYDQIWAEFEDALAAVVDTTSNSGSYGFLLLAKHPKVQQRVYDELVTVTKRNGLKDFDYSILNELHVFRAFIHEMLRIGSVSPTGVPHMTTEDVTVDVDGRNMVIPKYTLLYSNALYIHRWLDWNDENKPLKEENNDIHLEYWLDAESGKFKMNQNFVMFSVGKRDCAGRSLAMKSLYALFAIFLLKYKLVAPNDDPEGMEIEQEWSLTLMTKPMGINVERR